MPILEEIKAQVRKQVEFYFSDSNLPRDAFLLDIIQNENNPDQWVDLNVITAFSRMKSFLKLDPETKPEAVPESTLEDVADALESSAELCLSDDRRKVRRSQPLGSIEETLKKVDERSLFVSPFPFDATLQQITDFFNEQAPVRAVRMRRHLKSKDFRGSCFVEFDSAESAKKVLEMSLEHAGAPLRMMPKTQYKEEAIQARHSRKNSPFAGKDGKSEGKDDGGAENDEGEGAPEEGEAPDEVEFEPGLVLQFKFKEEEEVAEDITREAVRDALGEGIVFVKYNRGDREGHVRFRTADYATQALAAAGESKELSIGGKATVLSKLEGDAEVEFWRQAQAAKRDFKNRRSQSRGGRRGGRGRGGGRRDFKRKHHGNGGGGQADKRQREQ